MLCFRDMTFCGSKCANTDCHRMLTDIVKAEAYGWWGKPGAPIAVADFAEMCSEFQPTPEIPHG